MAGSGTRRAVVALLAVALQAASIDIALPGETDVAGGDGGRPRAKRANDEIYSLHLNYFLDQLIAKVRLDPKAGLKVVEVPVTMHGRQLAAEMVNVTSLGDMHRYHAARLIPSKRLIVSKMHSVIGVVNFSYNYSGIIYNLVRRGGQGHLGELSGDLKLKILDCGLSIQEFTVDPVYPIGILYLDGPELIIKQLRNGVREMLDKYREQIRVTIEAALFRAYDIHLDHSNVTFNMSEYMN